jgi:hypothetical protein
MTKLRDVFSWKPRLACNRHPTSECESTVAQAEKMSRGAVKFRDLRSILPTYLTSTMLTMSTATMPWPCWHNGRPQARTARREVLVEQVVGCSQLPTCIVSTRSNATRVYSLTNALNIHHDTSSPPTSTRGFSRKAQHPSHSTTTLFEQFATRLHPV